MGTQIRVKHDRSYHARGQKNKNARTVPCARSHDWYCDRKIGTKSATVIPKSDHRRGPGRNLMLGIVVAGGGGGGGGMAMWMDGRTDGWMNWAIGQTKYM